MEKTNLVDLIKQAHFEASREKMAAAMIEVAERVQALESKREALESEPK